MDIVRKVTRRNGIAHIELECEENTVLRVPSAFYLSHPLFPRQRFESEKYLFLYTHTAHEYALQDALNYLALRERSEKEIRDKLRRTEYPDEAIDRAIAVLYEKCLLSDARFARQWVDHRAKQYGRARIAQEIRMKGVSDAEVRQALDEGFSAEDEAESARKQAVRALRRVHGDRQKALQSLMRRGYSYTVAKEAVNSASEAEGLA